MPKVLEKIILHKLKPFNKIRNEQHAFRTEYSTTTQLLTPIDEISSKIHSSQKIGAIFLDMEKAFDRV